MTTKGGVTTTVKSLEGSFFCNWATCASKSALENPGLLPDDRFVSAAFALRPASNTTAPAARTQPEIERQAMRMEGRNIMHLLGKTLAGMNQLPLRLFFFL
jgi:hypothetical protein